MAKASGMNDKIRRFARAARRYRPAVRLEKAGAQAAGHYGHQVYGVFGSNLLAMRRRLGHVASSARRGRCLTSVLDLRCPGQDPGYKLPRECLRLWLSTWSSTPRVQAGVQAVWSKAVTKFRNLAVPERARNIRGPMGAVICNLLQYDWDPVAPTEWGTKPGGMEGREAFIFDQMQPHDDVSDLLDEFEASVRAHQWRAAATHFCGAGLEAGADNASYRRLLLALERAGHGHQLAEMMLCVAVGGTWPRQRVRDEVGGDVDVMCPRCGEAPETAFHRAWACRCNTGAIAYTASDTLSAQAYAQHEADACFWLRGIIPAHWTRVDPVPTEYSWKASGNQNLMPRSWADAEGFSLGVGSVSSPLFVFGDASGGEDTRDAVLRRVGICLVSIASFAPFRIAATLRSPLPGRNQSVPRGELTALWAAIEYSSGFLVFVTDNQAVMDGWHAGVFRHPQGPNQDLWRRIGALECQRDFSDIVVLQVASHQSGASLEASGTPLWLALGNEAADEVASVAAREARLPQATRARVAQAENKASLVRARLLRANLEAAALEKRAPVKKKDRRPPPSAASLSFFGSQHVFSADGRSCTRCHSCSSKACLTEWRKTSCIELQSQSNSSVLRLPRGQSIHIGGGMTHPSHELLFHTGLNLWFCSSCGCFASVQLRPALAKPCQVSPESETPRKISPTGQVYLDRIQKGLWPKYK